jgi:small subunit ribosomal protein S16
MLSIKLRPVGKKKQRSFRIVIIQKHSKLTGAFVEDVGWFNPHTDLFSVSQARVRYWLDQGAQPTDSVHNILVKAKVIDGPKIPVHSTKKKKGEVIPPVREAAPRQEESVRETPSQPATQEVTQESTATPEASPEG